MKHTRDSILNSENKYNSQLDDIANSSLHQQLVYFVGAGASMGYGLPNWQGFADAYLNKLYNLGIIYYRTKEKLKQRPYLEVLSICEKLMEGKKDRSAFLYDLFVPNYDKGKNGICIYDTLVKIPATYISTNYDCFLLEAYNKNRRENNSSPNKPFVSILPTVELNKESKVTQIHGYIRKKENGETESDCLSEKLIISNKDYINKYHLNQDKGNAKELEKILTKNTIVFIGYGLGEIEILRYLLNNNTSDETPPRYLLLGVLSDDYDYLNTYQEYLSDYGIEIIPYIITEKGHDTLEDVLKSIIDLGQKLKTKEINENIDKIYKLNKSNINEGLKIIKSNPKLISYFTDKVFEYKGSESYTYMKTNNLFEALSINYRGWSRPLIFIDAYLNTYAKEIYEKSQDTFGEKLKVLITGYMEDPLYTKSIHFQVNFMFEEIAKVTSAKSFIELHKKWMETGKNSNFNNDYRSIEFTLQKVLKVFLSKSTENECQDLAFINYIFSLDDKKLLNQVLINLYRKEEYNSIVEKYPEELFNLTLEKIIEETKKEYEWDYKGTVIKGIKQNNEYIIIYNELEYKIDIKDRNSNVEDIDNKLKDLITYNIERIQFAKLIEINLGGDRIFNNVLSDDKQYLNKTSEYLVEIAKKSINTRELKKEMIEKCIQSLDITVLKIGLYAIIKHNDLYGEILFEGLKKGNYVWKFILSYEGTEEETKKLLRIIVNKEKIVDENKIINYLERIIEDGCYLKIRTSEQNLLAEKMRRYRELQDIPKFKDMFNKLKDHADYEYVLPNPNSGVVSSFVTEKFPENEVQGKNLSEIINYINKYNPNSYNDKENEVFHEYTKKGATDYLVILIKNNINIVLDNRIKWKKLSPNYSHVFVWYEVIQEVAKKDVRIISEYLDFNIEYYNKWNDKADEEWKKKQLRGIVSFANDCRTINIQTLESLTDLVNEAIRIIPCDCKISYDNENVMSTYLPIFNSLFGALVTFAFRSSLSIDFWNGVEKDLKTSFFEDYCINIIEKLDNNCCKETVDIVFGMYYYNVCYLNSEWTNNRFQTIMGTDRENAFWTGYIYKGVNKTSYIKLKDKIARALVDKDISLDVRKKLTERATLAYLNDVTEFSNILDILYSEKDSIMINTVAMQSGSYKDNNNKDLKSNIIKLWKKTIDYTKKQKGETDIELGLFLESFSKDFRREVLICALDSIDNISTVNISEFNRDGYVYSEYINSILEEVEENEIKKDVYILIKKYIEKFYPELYSLNNILEYLGRKKEKEFLKKIGEIYRKKNAELYKRVIDYIYKIITEIN